MRAAEHAPRVRCQLFEPRLGLAEIVERGGWVLVERHHVQWYERECETTLHTWHFELGLIASFPGLISGYQPGMPLEGHVRAMEFAVVSQIHEERSIEDQGTYIIERLADLISGPHLAWR